VRKSGRNYHGQALAQGAGGLAIMALIFVGALAIVTTAAQVIAIQASLRSAAMLGAQEALNSTAWSENDTPTYSSNSKSNVLMVVNTALEQMGLEKLGSDSLLELIPATATGTAGEYAFAVVLRYPFLPAFNQVLPQGAFDIRVTGSVTNAFQPHKLVWIYADPPDGVSYFPAGNIVRGGVLVPAFGGGTQALSGSPVGTFTQYGEVLIGTYVYPPVRNTF